MDISANVETDVTPICGLLTVNKSFVGRELLMVSYPFIILGIGRCLYLDYMVAGKNRQVLAKREQSLVTLVMARALL